MNIFAICMIAASIAAATAFPQIEEQVYKDLAEKRRITAILHFKGPSNAELREKFRAEFHATGKAFNHDTLPALLTANANKHQAQTLEFLKSRQSAKGTGSNFLQLWLLNQIAVYDMDLELLSELKKSNEVTYIEANREYELLEKTEVNEPSTKNRPDISNVDGPNILQHRDDVQYGVNDVYAPLVWKAGYTGRGVVVGIINTGVRETHEILKDNYRDDYGWVDATVSFPLNSLRSRRPFDDNGEGTHFTGVMVGKKGYGVAPDAKWIACKAFTANKVYNTVALRECGQFMACPTDYAGMNANCSKRPHIISNSWLGHNPIFFDDIVKTWIANGQIPIFDIGELFRTCTSAFPYTTPSNILRPPAYVVSATNSGNKVANFSSGGTIQKDGRRKNRRYIKAPGYNTKSAGNASDDSYRIRKGTDTGVSASHVAGIAALLISKNPKLTPDRMEEVLEESSPPGEPDDCGRNYYRINPVSVVADGKIYATRGINMI